MFIEHITEFDDRLSIVECMLDEIEGITTNSFNINPYREIKSLYYLGFQVDLPACVLEAYSESVSEVLILNFGLISSLQGVGLGKLFLLSFEELFRNQGYSNILLTATPKSLGFYAAMNYVKIGKSEFSLVKNILNKPNK